MKRTPKSLECMPTGESEHGEAEGDELNDEDLTFKMRSSESYLGSVTRNVPMPLVMSYQCVPPINDKMVKIRSPTGGHYIQQDNQIVMLRAEYYLIILTVSNIVELRRRIVWCQTTLLRNSAATNKP